jgi:hypothetical protein
LRGLGHERELRGTNEPEISGIVLEEPEVVHRVAIDRHELDFFLIQENRLCDDRPRRNDVAIGQYQTALGIDDESCRLAGLVSLSIE